MKFYKMLNMRKKLAITNYLSFIVTIVINSCNKWFSSITMPRVYKDNIKYINCFKFSTQTKTGIGYKISFILLSYVIQFSMYIYSYMLNDT